MNAYSTMCDDFGVSCNLIAKMDMPSTREPVLHFFEALQKITPGMTEFERRENGEFALEEDRESGHYRWVTLDNRRLGTGYAGPPTIEEADEHNMRVLEMAPYHLDLGALTTEALDVLFYFEFLYQGNHDEVVAEALASQGPLEGISQIPASRVLHYQPTIMMALDEQCQLQARLNVETRTNAYQVRTGNFPEVPISVYFTVRQFWGKQSFKTYKDSYRNQRRILDELVDQYVVPNVVQPLQKAIAAKQ
jgi:hypothetical protein